MRLWSIIIGYGFGCLLTAVLICRFALNQDPTKWGQVIRELQMSEQFLEKMGNIDLSWRYTKNSYLYFNSTLFFLRQYCFVICWVRINARPLFSSLETFSWW